MVLKSSMLDTYAPIAQLDRAVDFESKGRGFKSLWARLYFFKGKLINKLCCLLFFLPDIIYKS